MDNVTHSLAGLLLAEGAVRLRARRDGAEPSARFRTTAAIASVVAANLPDFDLLYTGIGDDHLAYMLYHRGYTHTVLLAIVGAVVVWGIAWLVWRWRGRAAPPRVDARWLFGLLLASTLSHLVLDWTNSYGVHPFWPVDDRWYYGDAVFILEPWFWVVSVPALVLATRSWVVRVMLGLLLPVVLLAAWRGPAGSTGVAIALTIGALLSLVLALLLKRDSRVVAACAGWLAVTLVMATGASIARRAVERVLRDEDPTYQLLDVAVTPLPANAMCFHVVTVERSGTLYRSRSGRVTTAPDHLAAARCDPHGNVHAIDLNFQIPSTREVHWDGEWTAPIAELTTLARESCPARAALRFMRIPGLARVLVEGRVHEVLEDARYGGFATVDVSQRSAPCPPHVPPWTPPRADLLGAAIDR